MERVTWTVVLSILENLHHLLYFSQSDSTLDDQTNFEFIYKHQAGLLN